MRAAILCALTSFALATCQAQTSPVKGVYHDEALHFDFTYPAEFKLTPQVAKAMMDDTRDRVPDAMKASASCVTTPFAAEHENPQGITEGLFVIRIDLTCMNMPASLALTSQYLGAVATGALHEGLAKFVATTFGKPIAYKLASRDASFVQGTGMNGPGGHDGYSAVACVAVDRNAVCWAAFTPDKDRLPVLLSSTVGFGTDAPTAVVPSVLFSK